MKLPIYLDYAATTPMDPAVADKLITYLTEDGIFGNPASTQHIYGQQAAQAIEHAVGQVAVAIGADAKDIIWTSGATEANNLAIKGIAHFYQHKGKHIVTSQIEHKSVLDSCAQLAKEGFTITYVAPQPNGIIKIDDVLAAIQPDTILVSIMHVNNELGVIQDIASLGTAIKQHNQAIYFHVDAAQSVGKLPLNLQAIPVDLMSLSAHKVYGPKGIGALYIRRKPPVKLTAQIHGGAQQRGMRSGTLPTHQIVAMGEAYTKAYQQLDKDLKYIHTLHSALLTQLSDIADMQLNTSLEDAVPHIVNISFAGVSGEQLLAKLKDLALSSGAACDSTRIEPSHVLKAIGISREQALSAIRISLGRYTTLEEVEYAARYIRQEVERLRAG